MFYNFNTGPSETTSKDSTQDVPSRRRRLPTTHACEPCRRRKVKCTGNLPCESCKWHRKSAQCHYIEPNQRPTANRRSVDRAANPLLNQYQVVFQQLFPNMPPDQLVELSREELIDLVTKNSPQSALQHVSPLSPAERKRSNCDPDANSLETFQPMPEDESDASDKQSNKALAGIQDDVNALSLSVKQTSSYLGISSVMAILRIIVWLDPEAQTVFRRTPDVSAVPSREATSPSTPIETEDLETQNDNTSMSAWDEIPQINAYFKFFHPMVPLLDEQSFRDTYIAHARSDSRWLLLLNIVLALGSAVNGTVYDTNHRLYYSRAQRYLTIETLGSAHIETIQALTLLSGYYLHYLQLPNQANSLMGSTMRLATGLGLHRDHPEKVSLSKKEKVVLSVEIRRRVWWCMVCLDSWFCGTLGRPSMGRLGPAVTVKVPEQQIGNSMSMLNLLQENIRYVSISTRAEDALSISPIIDNDERTALDTAYLEWYKTSSVTDATPRATMAAEAIGISVAKNIMRWRYLWSRVVLHRPVLLWYAMRKIPFHSLAKDRQSTVELCRELTADLINDIATTWAGRNRCIMSGWHATWLLYQGTMVPLLLLFMEHVDDGLLEKSHALVQTSMRTLSDMVGYAHTAKRSLEVISLVYEASKRSRFIKSQVNKRQLQSNAITPNTNPASINIPPFPGLRDTTLAHESSFTNKLDTPQQEMVMENMFDSLNWGFEPNYETQEFDDFSNLDDPFDYAGLIRQAEHQSMPLSWFNPALESNWSNYLQERMNIGNNEQSMEDV